jgi:hypothetical protein
VFSAVWKNQRAEYSAKMGVRRLVFFARSWEGAPLWQIGKDRALQTPHSSRKRIEGLTDSARCAGIQVAISPSNNMASTTPANTSGSRGVA